MRVGIIGDTHEPFCHPGYLKFVQDTFQKYRVQQVVHIGDVVDNHAISFHEHDPNGMSAGDEYGSALAGVQRWYRAFPRALVCIGNHDERHYRRAKHDGLPKAFVRSYNEVWQTPKWTWATEHEIDGWTAEHGTGASGQNGAFNRSVDRRRSVGIGHIHSFGGVHYHANTDNRIFALNVGCGIDIKSYAFDYGKAFTTRPTLGCGIVLDGEQAIFVPMPLGPGEKYNRKRFRKNRRK